jgi:hypothetical protein
MIKKIDLDPGNMADMNPSEMIDVDQADEADLINTVSIMNVFIKKKRV